MATDDGESLRDRIFPPGPARDGHIIRAGLVSGWESQVIGLGRLTGFVSPRLLSQSHAVDDAALAVVFLQRHRVEVGLKLVLERAGQAIPGTHKLAHLLRSCEQACASIGLGGDWKATVGQHTEYIELMDTVDPDAATYRYPVDRSLTPWSREPLVDLLELEAAGRALQVSILSVVGLFASREPLPISREDAQITANELAALAVACQGVVQLQHDSTRVLRNERKKLEALTLPLGRPATPEISPEALAPANALVEVTLALADRAKRMLDLIVANTSVGVIRPPIPARSALRPFPSFLDVSPAAWHEQQDAQIKWFAESAADKMRVLMDAVRAVETRSASWTEPAARQLHIDVTRFRSRLISEAGAPKAASA
jgi:hypothetical protein